MEIREFKSQAAGQRLDKALVDLLADLSRAQIQDLIGEGHVLVNGQAVKAGNKLKGGEEIRVEIPEKFTKKIEAEAIPLNVLYEDADIVVLEKDAGMVVHPGVAQESGTLVHALLSRYPEIAKMADDPRAEGRMGIVHRLDKDTSGVMVAARNLDALVNLMAQFKARTTEKIYLALLENQPQTPTGKIDAPIGRDPRQRKRMAVVRSGKPASTEYEVIDTDFQEERALVKLQIHTGRTHQIRVHMAFIKCPIIGDKIYGYRKQRVGMKRNFLHASELSFEHPSTGERLHFKSELPKSLQAVMDKLRTSSPEIWTDTDSD